MPTYIYYGNKAVGKYREYIEPKDDNKEVSLTVYLNADGTTLIMTDEKPYFNFLVLDTQISNADLISDYTIDIPLDIQDEYGLKITPILLPIGNATILDAVDYLQLYINSKENTPAISLFETFYVSKLAGKFKRLIFSTKSDRTDIQFKINIKIGQAIS